MLWEKKFHFRHSFVEWKKKYLLQVDDDDGCYIEGVGSKGNCTKVDVTWLTFPDRLNTVFFNQFKVLF